MDQTLVDPWESAETEDGPHYPDRGVQERRQALLTPGLRLKTTSLRTVIAALGALTGAQVARLCTEPKLVEYFNGLGNKATIVEMLALKTLHRLLESDDPAIRQLVVDGMHADAAAAPAAGPASRDAMLDRLLKIAEQRALQSMPPLELVQEPSQD